MAEGHGLELCGCCSQLIAACVSGICALTTAAAAAAAVCTGLGPVTLIFTFVNYIWNSQGIATTTLVADALNRPSPDSKHPPHVEAGRVLASSLLMAAAMGVAACTCLQLFGPGLLQMTGAAPELIDPALSYLRIRALATPASYGESLPLCSTSTPPPPPTHCHSCCVEGVDKGGGEGHPPIGELGARGHFHRLQ